MRKLLVANRGEIAARIMQTAHRMGIFTVAIASEVDAAAPHVSLADEVMFIGADLVTETYLDIAKVIQSAVDSGADAIHPGYGFLSENAMFAEAVRDAGLIWVGPPAEAIVSMGDKATAKEKMAAAGVPMAKGYFGSQSIADLHQAALEVGFPLLVKAVAGGGGRGIRIVRTIDELAQAVERAQSEALSAFGNAEVMLERFLEAAKHIEIQVFADLHGNVVHLFERDCSTQRRRQKIIEEAPSVSIDERLREQMGKTAVQATKAIGYVGAGTLEFLVVGDEYYFLEMNTRLQVEHPVTELITGLDLVEWQIRVADGEKLPRSQEEISRQGHAIEARIYAEDPSNNYLPSTGKIDFWHPSEEKNVWIHSGIQSGQTVSSFYDPMLAKITVWGHDRASAIRQMHRAIAHSVLIGPTTNHGLLLDIFDGVEFQSARMHTLTLETASFPSHEPDDDEWMVAAILGSHPTTKPWNSRGKSSWSQDVAYAEEQRSFSFQTSRTEQLIAYSDQQHSYSISERTEHQAVVRLGNYQRRWFFVKENEEIVLWAAGRAQVFSFPSNEPAQSEASEASLLSPMSGRIIQILATSGVEVKKGEPVLIIEAMKMEHPVLAGCDGVLSLHCAENDQVQSNQLLGAIGEVDG